MSLFDRMHQAQPRTNDLETAAASNMSTTQMPGTVLLRHAFSTAIESIEAHGRLLIEPGLIGLGALVLSALFIWATVTDRVSVEAIVVMIVVLILSMVTVSQGMRYHTRNVSLQE